MACTLEGSLVVSVNPREQATFLLCNFPGYFMEIAVSIGSSLRNDLTIRTVVLGLKRFLHRTRYEALSGNKGKQTVRLLRNAQLGKGKDGGRSEAS